MHKTPEITTLIHANFWLVISFAFVQPRLGEVLETRFRGEWKYLRNSFYELAEIRADRALLEMATQLRVLDDSEGISEYLKQTKGPCLGKVTQGDGTVTDLFLRDMTNKVMHAAAFEWDFSERDAPKVNCIPHDKERWKKAEVDLIVLAGFVGMLMF